MAFTSKICIQDPPPNHWDALACYFNSHDQVESDGMVHRLALRLKNPEVKMYFYYLEFILVPLNDFNTIFQASIMTFKIHFENVNACTFCLKVPYANRDKQLSNDIELLIMLMIWVHSYWTIFFRYAYSIIVSINIYI